MALTLADLQTYTGQVYANAQQAQSRLDIVIAIMSQYLGYQLGASYGFSDLGDLRPSASTTDSLRVTAIPSGGAANGSIKVEKLTTKNATINVDINGTIYALTDAAPTVTVPTLAANTYPVTYGNYVWDVTIAADDVGVLPKDVTTGQPWHIFPFEYLNYTRIEPSNLIYRIALVDCKDRFVRDLQEGDDYVVEGHKIRMCAEQSVHGCHKEDLRIAVNADWSVPQALENIAFELASAEADAPIFTTGPFTSERIGSYSYTRASTAELSDAADNYLKKYESVLKGYALSSAEYPI